LRSAQFFHPTGFEIGSALELDLISEGSVVDRLLPARDGVAHLRRMNISTEQAALVRNGRRLPLDLRAIKPAPLKLPAEPSEMRIALLDPNDELVAIAGAGRQADQLQPQIVFRD
jgi:tRNA U55 pseudouridine synthase TruB